MSRSLKKGPFVEAKLYARIEAMNNSGAKQVIKTWFSDPFVKGNKVLPR